MQDLDLEMGWERKFVQDTASSYPSNESGYILGGYGIESLSNRIVLCEICIAYRDIISVHLCEGF